MPRVKMLGNRVATADLRIARPPVTQGSTSLIYHTPEFAVWREHVIARAGRRCEAVDNGRRCWKAEAHGHRMFADHVIELNDQGAPFDPANGQCLCGSHHTIKTNRAKAARQRSTYP